MISAISWVPKVIAAKVEPPTKEEIDEILKSGTLEGIEIFSTAIGDRYYPSNEMDPYLKKDDEDENDDKEIKDMTIKPSDAVIVCAHTDDEVSQLRACNCVCVLEELEDGELNFYSHHDVILSALLLCIAWRDWNFNGGDKGNYIAVGTSDPAIKIWDLNLTAKYKKGSHTDSVLGLDWNKKLKYLASASADKSVKVWDLDKEKCCMTVNHHTDKFLDVECLAWDQHDQHSCLVSLEDGTVQGFDVRVVSSDPATACLKPSFTLQAHDKPVTSISYCPTAPKTDKMVKLWDLSNNQPSCGAVFSTSFSEDCPFLLAVGGSKEDLQVWDTLTENEVARRFGKYSNRKPPPHE
ncbi:hypothetical protein MKX01_039062 [Papaver californicum]|nr:hypothetical protein MKX01_039062 [Papaver californicum]